MFKSEVEFHAKLSYKAKYGAREFDQILKYEQRPQSTQRIELDTKALQYQIIEEKQSYYLELFLSALAEAVVETGEYDRLEIFSENIVSIFTVNIMDFLSAIIEFGAYGVYNTMDEKAGDLSDFWEGVENAREMLDTSRKDVGRAARYWMHKVWPNDEMYQDTIAYRFQVWDDKAPYWHFLEHGNYLSSRAFPNFTATRFLSKTAYKIIDDLEIEVAERKEAAQEDSEEVEEINEEYIEKKINLFDKAVMELEENPDKYQPGYVWGTYKSLEDERIYRVVLTKTGQVGRRVMRRKMTR